MKKLKMYFENRYDEARRFFVRLRGLPLQQVADAVRSVVLDDVIRHGPVLHVRIRHQLRRIRR
jgi:hypothetical protein